MFDKVRLNFVGWDIVFMTVLKYAGTSNVSINPNIVENSVRKINMNFLIKTFESFTISEIIKYEVININLQSEL